MHSGFLFVICALLANRVCGSSVWDVDQYRLEKGENLVYTAFGPGESGSANVRDILDHLHIAGKHVVCVDSTETTARQMMGAFQEYQERVAGNGNGDETSIALVVKNVEQLVGDDILNLDFLFRLPDQSFSMTKLVVVLLWDTDKVVINEDSWGEDLRKVWASVGPSFNADAAIGRISRPLFFSTLSLIAAAGAKESSSQLICHSFAEVAQTKRNAMTKKMTIDRKVGRVVSKGLFRLPAIKFMRAMELLLQASVAFFIMMRFI